MTPLGSTFSYSGPEHSPTPEEEEEEVEDSSEEEEPSGKVVVETVDFQDRSESEDDTWPGLLVKPLVMIQ